MADAAEPQYRAAAPETVDGAATAAEREELDATRSGASFITLTLAVLITVNPHTLSAPPCTDASGGEFADLIFPVQERENAEDPFRLRAERWSSLHCRTQDGRANDHFAPTRSAGIMRARQRATCAAAASGTVIAAGWGSSGWAAYGQRIYIEHDFNADGHKYTTLYAHLDSISVSEGQHVNKGDVIGALGQSCNGTTSCSNFSTPHVHFSLHRDSNFGGSGSGGSYAGRAVRPEPMDGVTGISQGQIHVSKNGRHRFRITDLGHSVGNAADRGR
jgi:hypothetical protein